MAERQELGGTPLVNPNLALLHAELQSRSSNSMGAIESRLS